MSFVTKRERVFNEYKLYDLPARNEGKLKAYASCTDARAWSHFISDKTEHLFEIIRRNNETCRPKYVPTEVIVDTLMMAKNAQISRLKQRIAEAERLLAAYDRLDLTPAQRAEIAKAHATIKAANKELDDLYIDLDLSGDTEGIDSEAFGTGKSRGDEISRSTPAETAKSSLSEWSYIKEPTTESLNGEKDHELTDRTDAEDRTEPTGPGDRSDRAKFCNRVKFCDTGTNAEEDSRIEELQDMIVTKDARLNAMQNTIAVLENDVCEPYCIYAHIYTALEKILAILRQNLKYKQYLDLLTLGKDIQHIHIKGKILYKIKILEKFSIALIAPCSQTDKHQNCTCYRAEILTGYETAYAVTATESSQTIIDKKRAHLIADIIDVDEIKEALNDQSFSKSESDSVTEFFDIDECNLENKSRYLIKSIQSSYRDLLTCYENLKSEKDLLYVRCQELLKVEEENLNLRNHMKDYNNLWNEMEYYRKRSESLDKLKAKYYLLLNETTNLESKFIAESEKNKIKSDTINELRHDNVLLDRKLRESLLVHEKEKNVFVFKMKEMECTNMCKEQQIKSLTSEIEKIFNQNVRKKDMRVYQLLDQIATEQDQNRLEERCNCQTAAIEHAQNEAVKYQEYINELKLELETLKKKYDDALDTHDTLNNKIRITDLTNHELNEIIFEKTNAIHNLHDIIKKKSEQIEKLNEEVEMQKSNNVLLLMQINKTRHNIDLEPDFTKEDEKILDYKDTKISHDPEFDKCDEKHVFTKKDEVSHHSLKSNSFNNNESVFGYNHTMDQHDTLLHNIAEREDLDKCNKLIPVNKRASENNMQHKAKYYLFPENDTLAVKSVLINNNAEEIMTEISKMQNDLNKKLSILENEQQIFIIQKSTESDTSHIMSTYSTHDPQDNLNSSDVNLVEDNLLSKIKLLRQCSTATITKYDLVKENYRKSLSITKKEVADLQKELAKLENNYANNKLNKTIQDKCDYNEKLIEQLEQKNDTIKKLLTDINEMRIDFQEKISTLEREKNNLFNYFQEKQKLAHIEFKLIENDKLCFEDKDTSEDQSNVLPDFKLFSEENAAFESAATAASPLHDDNYDQIEINKIPLELTNNKSAGLQLNKISQDLQDLTSKHSKLFEEKNLLQNELHEKMNELKTLKDKYQQVFHLVEELEPYKLKYEMLNTDSENKVAEKEAEINELRKINTLLEKDLTVLSSTIECLKQKYRSLEQEFQNLKEDKGRVHTKLEAKINELEVIKESLVCSEKHNNDLQFQINSFEQNEISNTNKISILQNEAVSMQLELDELKKEIIEKDKNLNNLESINSKFINLQISSDEMKKENYELRQDLNECKRDFKKLEDESKVVKMLHHNIVTEMESIKAVLKIKEDEIIRTSSLFNDKKDEIEKLKVENSYSNDRVLDLLNKLELCEQIINKLKDDLGQRNETIFQLQNQINNLQEEIKKLHESLELAIESSEKLSQEDIKEIDDSVKKVKAHYSKATHNIKPELVKLQDINEKLKLLKLGSKDINIEKEKCISKINALENERVTVIHNLNQLEVGVLGHSSLTTKSSTKDIIDVLQNIHKAYEDKNSYFENKILSAQGSYQILKSKAEEAEKIAEDERQNMINDKESNARNYLELERKLLCITDHLQNEDLKYKDIIKELETKLMNQQIFFEEISKSQENRIEMLDKELSDLMEIYKKSLIDLDALQEKINHLEDQSKIKDLKIMELHDDYEKKCTEIKILQDILKTRKNIDIESQTDIKILAFNKSIQVNERDTELKKEANNTDKEKLKSTHQNNDSDLKKSNNVRKQTISSKKNQAPEDIKRNIHVVNKLEKLQIKVLDQFSLCTVVCENNLNSFYKEFSNTDISLKFCKSENTILKIKPLDSSIKVLDSTVNDIQMEKELINKIIYHNKNTQTKDGDSLYIQKIIDVVPHVTNIISTQEKGGSKSRLTDSQRVSLVKDSSSYSQIEEIKSTKKQKPRDIKSSKVNLLNEKNMSYKTSKKPSDQLGSGISKRKITVPIKSIHSYTSRKEVFPYEEGSNHLVNLSSKSLSLEDMRTRDKVVQKQLNDLRSKNEMQYEIPASLTENQSVIETNDSNKLQNILLPKRQSELHTKDEGETKSSNQSRSHKNTLDIGFEKEKSFSTSFARPIKLPDKYIPDKSNDLESYETKIEYLSKALVEAEKDHQKKIEAVKHQYENHIKNIINEHNKGVVSIQTLHEETLSDVIKIHDIEIENLRALSIEAMTKSEKLEKDNKKLRLKMEIKELDQRPARVPEIQKRKFKSRPSYLTKTDVEAFNVKPKRKPMSPCSCSMDVSVSDVIRNIFEQADAQHRKIAEETYLKYIADKLMNGIENLNPRELSFLHLKVCRIWKTRRNREITLKGDFPMLEHKLLSLEPHLKQKNEHDKVVRERRRCREGRPITNLPAEFGGPVQDNNNRRNKKVCGCLYNIKYERRHTSCRPKTSGASEVGTNEVQQGGSEDKRRKHLRQCRTNQHGAES